MHVVDEYVSPGRTTEAQDALAIQQMLERHGLSLFSVSRARGDVNAAGKSAARWSVNQQFERAFTFLAGRLPFNIERPRKGPGSILRAAKVVNSACLEGRLTVSPRCKQLLQSLRHWRGENDDTKHAFDALGYLAADLLDGSRREVARVAVV